MTAHTNTQSKDNTASSFTPARGLVLQRKCACGSSSSSVSGACPECQNKRLQTKLRIGASNDPLEQEADRVADQVMSAGNDPIINTAPPRIQRLTSHSSGENSSAPASVNRVLASGGRPLEPVLQQDMSQRFGHDFSRVRVHSDSEAQQSARDANTPSVERTFGAAGLRVPIMRDKTLGAAAMTVGGRVSASNPVPAAILGHEIAHGIQQGDRGTSDDSITTNTRGALEAEAEAAGHAFAQGEPFEVRGRAPRTVALYAGPTQAEQQLWEDDWNDAAFRADHYRFEGPDRPSGNDKARYDALCPLYFAQGILRPLQYVHNYIEDVRFFQFETPVHRDLVAPVQKAERLLQPNFDATALRSFWGFNARTTSTGGWSNHANGRAIDIDPGTNPHFDKKKQRQVISAVTEMDIEAPIPGAEQGAMDAYAGMETASFRFQVRFSEQGLQDALNRLEDLRIDQEIRVSFFRDELAGFPRNTSNRALRNEIKSNLARARVRYTDIKANIQVVNAELNRLGREDRAVAAAETALEIAEADERFLTAAIATATPSEQRTLRRSLGRATRAVRKQGAVLAKARKRAAENPLRGFAETGFLTLPRELVDTMKQVGFEWGGDIWPDHKDLMHFQIP